MMNPKNRGMKNSRNRVMRHSRNRPMKNSLEYFEDKQIIGTPRYEYFQRMCSNAGLSAIEEAKARGLPLTYVENDEIVKEHADGKKEILGRIKKRIRVKRVYKIP